MIDLYAETNTLHKRAAFPFLPSYDSISDRIVTDSQGYSYEYDNEGNVQFKYLTGDDLNRTEYVWDYRNRLVGLKIEHRADIYSSWEATSTTTYTYDPFNRLIGIKGSTQNEIFVYDGQNIVLIFNGSASANLTNADLSQRFFWGAGTDQLLAQENLIYYTIVFGNNNYVMICGPMYWYLTDYRGTTRDFAVYDPVNDDAQVQNVLETDAFGHVTWGNTYPINMIGFEGKLGGYFNARWYDAANGCFLSEDPDKIGTNLYVFCGNDPVNRIEPNGLEAIRTVYKERPVPKGVDDQTGSNIDHSKKRERIKRNKEMKRKPPPDKIPDLLEKEKQIRGNPEHDLSKKL